MAVSPGIAKFSLLGFLIFLAVNRVESARLNVPRVLLPFSERSPEFQLSGLFRTEDFTRNILLNMNKNYLIL